MKKYPVLFLLLSIWFLPTASAIVVRTAPDAPTAVSAPGFSAKKAGFLPKKGEKRIEKGRFRTFRRFAAAASDGRMTAILAYITIIGLIIAYMQHQDDPTDLGGFHLAQSLGNSLFFLGLLLVVRLIGIFIPVFNLVGLLVLLAVLINWVMGLVAASNRKEQAVPLGGKLFNKLFRHLFK